MTEIKENEPVLMSVQEFSEKSGIPEARVRRWLREGKIKGKKISRSWLIFRSEFHQIVNER